MWESFHAERETGRPLSVMFSRADRKTETTVRAEDKGGVEREEEGCEGEGEM